MNMLIYGNTPTDFPKPDETGKFAMSAPDQHGKLKVCNTFQKVCNALTQSMQYFNQKYAMLFKKYAMLSKKHVILFLANF